MSELSESLLYIPGEEYEFVGLIPHPIDPITIATFDGLDRAVADVNEQLGITAEDRFSYAFSAGKRREPNLSVIRYEGPNGLRVITAFSEKRGESVGVRARNDAGTRSDPHWPAAEARVLSRGGIILYAGTLANHNIIRLTSRVSERLQQGAFSKKAI